MRVYLERPATRRKDLDSLFGGMASGNNTLTLCEMTALTTRALRLSGPALGSLYQLYEPENDPADFVCGNLTSVPLKVPLLPPLLTFKVPVPQW